MITVILGCSLLVVWIGVLYFDRDAWPFSSYPMFSQSLPLEQVSVFRIRIIDAKGGEGWWKPPAAQINRDFDRGFRRALQQSMKGDSADATQFSQRFFSRWHKGKTSSPSGSWGDLSEAIK